MSDLQELVYLCPFFETAKEVLFAKRSMLNTKFVGLIIFKPKAERIFNILLLLSSLNIENSNIFYINLLDIHCLIFVSLYSQLKCK